MGFPPSHVDNLHSRRFKQIRRNCEIQISAANIEYWTTQEIFPSATDDIDSPS
jgi:hypothetical protein